MRRRIEFTFRNFKNQPTKAQAIVEGDRANLNRLFMLLCNHPRVEDVSLHAIPEITNGDPIAGPQYHQGEPDEG